MSNLGKIRMEILRLLWQTNRPMNLREISEKMNLKTRCVNMYLLNLVRAGYVKRSNKLYVLTDLGKEALGFPSIDEKLANKILSEVQLDKAFHFYRDLDEPLMVYSNSLTDFCEKIKSVDLKSIEFHVSRGDFEAWIHSLGDIELAHRLRLIRELGLSGESLREEVFKIVKQRCDELKKMLP